MDKAFEILARLQDGHAHSGAAIAAGLGVSRAAVWNRIKRLQAQGVDIYAVPGKGYQLPRGFEFLSAARIEEGLDAGARRTLQPLAVTQVTDSTNQRLLAAVAREDIHGRALIAEYQTAGRGRRGESWLAPPGSGICLSLAWRFDAPPSTMSALSLAIGVAVARAGRDLGARDIALKWPNDVLHAGRKLAGILIEMRSEYGGPSTVVIGIGLNCRLSADIRRRIPQPVADLCEAAGVTPSRNRVAAALLNAFCAVLREFSAAGFAPFADEWRRLDAYVDRPVELVLPDRAVRGIARGVDASGMLLIETAGRRESFLAGHLRPASRA